MLSISCVLLKGYFIYKKERLFDEIGMGYSIGKIYI